MKSFKSFLGSVRDWLDKYADDGAVKQKGIKRYDDTVPLWPTTDSRTRILKYLHPALRGKVEEALAECHSNDLMVYVFESYRTPARQQSLYDQGRTKKGRIVTNAIPFRSWHNYGLAFDLVFDGDERDGIQWSWDGDYNTEKLAGDRRSDYERVGEIFVRYGFEWGAQWKSFKEMPHFQMVGGMTIAYAKKLSETKGMQAVWSEISSRIF